MCIYNFDVLAMVLVFELLILRTVSKAVADGPVGQVLAGSLFLKTKTKFHFTKSK